MNSDAEKFFDAVLRRLGLQLARGGNERHKCEVNEDYVFGAEFEAHLADGFEKRQGLDVTYGAADFDQDDVRRVGAG